MLKLNIEQQNDLSNSEIERYGRQMIIKDVGIKGQIQIKNTQILVIGAGGIGSSVLMYLSACGIGKIGIIDNDVVDITNLHRQVIHKNKNQNKPKVISAKLFIQELNPNVEIETYEFRLDQKNARNIIKQYDYVIDGCDNALSRYIVNDACVLENKILISGASVKWEGQITIYNYKDGPCYRCLYPECPSSSQMMSCTVNGVIGMAPGITGQILVVQLLKVILESKNILSRKMLIINLLEDLYKVIKIRGRKKDCIVCSEDNNKVFDIEKYDYETFIGDTCEHWLDNIDPQINISWEDLFKLDIEKQIIVDVRSEGEFNFISFTNKQIIHFPFLIFINSSKNQILEKLKPQNKDQKIYIFCRRGRTSLIIAKRLKEIGIEGVNIIGGLIHYKQITKVNFPMIQLIKIFLNFIFIMEQIIISDNLNNRIVIELKNKEKKFKWRKKRQFFIKPELVSQLPGYFKIDDQKQLIQCNDYIKEKTKKEYLLFIKSDEIQKSNKEIYRQETDAQNLTENDIKKIEQNTNSQDLINIIKNNNKNFEKKNQISQQKYLERKNKKYNIVLYIQKCNIYNLNEYYFNRMKDYHFLRIDEISFFLNAINLYKNMNIFVVENTFGIICSYLIQRMTENDKIFLYDNYGTSFKIRKYEAIIQLGLKKQSRNVLQYLNTKQLIENDQNFDQVIITSNLSSVAILKQIENRINIGSRIIIYTRFYEEIKDIYKYFLQESYSSIQINNYFYRELQVLPKRTRPTMSGNTLSG